MKLTAFVVVLVLLCGSSTQQKGKSVLELFPEFTDLQATMQAQFQTQNADVKSIEKDVNELKGNFIIHFIRF